MRIPKEFKLFNQTIKIVFKRNLIDTKHAFGLWDYNKSTIYLQPSTRKHILTKQQIENTLIHEALHAALNMMGETKLSDNEAFVHTLSSLIQQLIEQITNEK